MTTPNHVVQISSSATFEARRHLMKSIVYKASGRPHKQLEIAPELSSSAPGNPREVVDVDLGAVADCGNQVFCDFVMVETIRTLVMISHSCCSVSIASLTARSIQDIMPDEAYLVVMMI